MKKLDELLSETPIEKILLAQKYNLSSWLVSGYERVCSQVTGLTVADGERIGYKTAFLLSIARERVLNQRHSYGSRMPPSPSSILRDVLGDDFPGGRQEKAASSSNVGVGLGTKKKKRRLSPPFDDDSSSV